MIVRKLRLQRGWSQEQLAEVSGLSVRTIQRIERGQKAGLESLKSLAAVLDVELTALQENVTMTSTPKLSYEEQEALERVRDIKGFYSHLITFAITISGLVVLNLLGPFDYFWALWPALGWGVGLVAHGLSVFEVFDFFGADWEKQQVEKRLGKKL